MGFSDKSGPSLAQKVGCAIYALVGGFVSLTAMGGAALGDCAPGGDCLSETGRAILFYGVPLSVLMGGALMIRHFMREKN